LAEVINVRVRDMNNFGPTRKHACIAHYTEQTETENKGSNASNPGFHENGVSFILKKKTQ